MVFYPVKTLSNTMQISKLCLLVGTMAFGLTGCNHKSAASEAAADGRDSLPEGIAAMIQAVADSDARAFASQVLYPLQRPYPLADVADSAAMVAYYGTLMDDSLRSVLTAAAPSDWHELGWRGFTLGNGEYLWYSDGIYAVNYLSAREKELRNHLVEAEMASLAPALRRGYTPEACFAALPGDEGIFRIDRSLTDTVADGSAAYRLCYYKGRRQLRRAPTTILYGRRFVEGTASTIHYEFRDSTAELSSLVYYPESEDGSVLVASVRFQGQPSRNLSVAPTYWLNLLQ